MKLSDLVTADEFILLCQPELGSCLKVEREDGYPEEYELFGQPSGYIQTLMWFGRDVMIGDEQQLITIIEKLQKLSAEERWFLSTALDDFADKPKKNILKNFDTWRPDPDSAFNPNVRYLSAIDLQQ